MERRYFNNVDTKEESLDLNSMELIIPEGFHKNLNSMEKAMLLDDQLLDYGLQLGYCIMGSHKVVPANKGSKHLEKNPQISKRLREYLIKFNELKRVGEDVIVMAAVVDEVEKMKDKTLETRNRIIEAVWRVIVGNDTPEPEDGKMLKHPYVQTKNGTGSIYNFIYKGKTEAVLTEVQMVPGKFSYFLDSDREIIGKVMEKVMELAAEEEEKTGRVCEQ